MTGTIKDLKKNIGKIPDLTKLPIETQKKITLGVPMRLRTKLYVKICSDEQLNMLIDEWTHTHNTEMLRLLAKQIKRQKRPYFNHKLDKFI